MGGGEFKSSSLLQQMMWSGGTDSKNMLSSLMPCAEAPAAPAAEEREAASSNDKMPPLSSPPSMLLLPHQHLLQISSEVNGGGAAATCSLAISSDLRDGRESNLPGSWSQLLLYILLISISPCTLHSAILFSFRFVMADGIDERVLIWIHADLIPSKLVVMICLLTCNHIYIYVSLACLCELTTQINLQWGISWRSWGIQRCHSSTVKRIGRGTYGSSGFCSSLQFLWPWPWPWWWWWWWWWGDPDIRDQQQQTSGEPDALGVLS